MRLDWIILKISTKIKSLPPKMYVKNLYKYYTGKKLDLENPQEFNAKIQWYKVFYHPKILNQLVDKYAVREFVEEKIGGQYLNEVYGVYDSADEVDFDKLPKKFVAKGTHASSINLIVTNKENLNLRKVKRTFKKWFKRNQYYRVGQEWAYKDVQPRIIIEKYLKEEGRSSLLDYKFYCFNGKPKFVEIHLEREVNHQRGFFDLEFNKLPFAKLGIKEAKNVVIEKPANFEEMVKFAEILAKNLPFVRVDFYSVQGKTIFGEMTFYPADGRLDFYPDKYNKIIGDYFELPKIPENQKVITEI